jgi:hypothetical protein
VESLSALPTHSVPQSDIICQFKPSEQALKGWHQLIDFYSM